MKIINNAGLPYEVIGQIMDKYINDSYADTCYYGKIDYFKMKYKEKIYKVQIRYLKSYVEWRFMRRNNE